MRFHRTIALLTLLIACKGNDAESSGLMLAISGGADQSGAAASALAGPLAVKVSDQHGPVANVTVHWTVTAGGGTVVPASSTTAADGIATTAFVLGSGQSAQLVSAGVSGLGSVTFDATVTGPAPVVTASAASGAGQFIAFGTAASQPVTVKVVDATGAPAAGQLITWSTTGATRATPAATISGADGIASTAITGGAAYADSMVSATVGAGHPVVIPLHLYRAPLRVTFAIPFDSFGVTCVGIRKMLAVGVGDSGGHAFHVPSVRFTLSTAGDSLSSPTATMASLGVAYDTLILGAALGRHAVTASVDAPPATGRTVFTVQTPCARTITAYAPTATVSAGAPSYLQAAVANDSGNLHVPIAWTVISGGGSVAPAPPLAPWPFIFTPGPASGDQIVEASAEGALPVRVTFHVLPAPAPVLIATVPATGATYYHDTFVRDGIAFAFEWNKGVMIYDVGNGVKGGSPASPQLISQLITSDDGVAGGPAVHNGWWFQNPVTSEKRYLFVGQEGPGTVGSSSTGDIHIVDVSNLATPHEVGFIHIAGAGAHNFWMDEANQVLYAAYYNGGVIKVDVSGALAGDMSSRIVAQVKPGGAGNTYTWGVMLSNGTLYASDMVSGFFALDPATLAVKGSAPKLGCGNGSDLWVAGNVAYQGNWGCFDGGARIVVMSLDASGIPTVDTTIIAPGGGSTMSDVAVTPDGKMLVGTTENGGSGLYIWSLANPRRPVLVANYLVNEGLHTAETKVINGRTYVFAARDPNQQQLMIFDITDVVH